MIAIGVLLAALSAPAATTVSLQREGEVVSRGEICRFAAGDAENPFQRWLSSQDAICVSAGAPIEFPRGRWNVFARADKAISSTPVLVDGREAPVDLALTLHDAATIVPALPAGRTAVAYAPRRGIAVPVANGGEGVLVPANEELWLIVLEKSKPVALFPIAALEARSVRAIDAPSAGPPALLGWLQVSESDRAVLEKERGLAPPVVRATLSGPSYDSDPLPPLHLLDGALVRVRGVPAGEVVLSVGGRGWVPDRTKAVVESALTIADEPLQVRVAGTVSVHWSTVGDIPALDRSLGSCEPPKSAPAFVVTLSRCPTPPPRESVDVSACSPIRDEIFPPHMNYGEFTVEDVVPGTYRAELRFGKLPPVSVSGQVGALQQRDLRMQAAYLGLYGSVTHGGEPLEEEVTIEFPGGGYGFTSSTSSDYQAALQGLIGMDAPIKVTACDGSPNAVVLIDRPLRPGARFDIDIPANELEIRVSDTFTREPLAGATVKLVAMSIRYPRRPVMTRTEMASRNERGDAAVVFKALPDRETHVTVSHAGYQKETIPPFSVAKSEQKALDVKLLPLRGNRGRIHSPVPFDSGAIYWYSPRGDEIERAELAADGTFVYLSPHEAGETMVVVSLSHPLWVARSQAVERHQALQLRFPDGPARTFEVSIVGADRRDNRHIGLTVGGVRVPQPPLRQHQFLRGQA